jgi:hypothetical protein
MNHKTNFVICSNLGKLLAPADEWSFLSLAHKAKRVLPACGQRYREKKIQKHIDKKHTHTCLPVSLKAAA